MAAVGDQNGDQVEDYWSVPGSTSSTPIRRIVTCVCSAVDDAPTVAVAPGATCGASDRDGTINLALTDVDSPVASLALTAASSNPALVPTGNVVFAGSGAARTLHATAAAGRTGAAKLTVSVGDGQTTGTVTVTVQAGGNGTDTLTGNGGTDILLGQNGNDTLSRNRGNDLLCGGKSDDTVKGGDGDDTPAGGKGDDTVKGGGGADAFSGGPGPDRATDLSVFDGDTTDGTVP